MSYSHLMHPAPLRVTLTLHCSAKWSKTGKHFVCESTVSTTDSEETSYHSNSSCSAHVYQKVPQKTL